MMEQKARLQTAPTGFVPRLSYGTKGAVANRAYGIRAVRSLWNKSAVINRAYGVRAVLVLWNKKRGFKPRLRDSCRVRPMEQKERI